MGATFISGTPFTTFTTTVPGGMVTRTSSPMRAAPAPPPCSFSVDPDFAAMLLRPSARRLGVPIDQTVALQPVQVVSGALLLLPRHLFARLGGFDAGYRLHAEDLDLCRRARDAGAFVAVANDVRVVHVRGVSSRSRPLFVEWHKHRGLWRYYRKFDAPRDGAPTRAAVFAMVWGRFPFAVLRAAMRR